MEVSCVLLAAISLVWAVDGFGIGPLGHFSEEHITQFFSHPQVTGTRHVREVAVSDNNNEGHKRKRPHRDGLLPYKHCCGGENNTEHSNHKEIKDIYLKCLDSELELKNEWSLHGNPTKDPFTCERMKKFKNHFYCIADCMMKNYGALGDDGSVDIDRWTEFTINDLAFPWLKDLATIAVEKCIANEDYSWLKNRGELECNPRAVDVNHCVWSQIMMTCPDEHFVKSSYCVRVKEAFEDVDG